MLQQTPVARVEPVWRAWLDRWPEPAHLAAEPAGAAVRAWGRLGYPRRALRLHEAAVVVRDRHAGAVPSEPADLRGLPGVGSYTAAAVATFGFPDGGRHAAGVVDTNVRRLHARAVAGEPAAAPAVTAVELRRAADLVPDDPAVARRWAVAGMELGALVCTARAPRCAECPLADRCAWRRAGAPPSPRPRTGRAQPWAGTDRQVRGQLLGALRGADAPLARGVLLASADAPVEQAERCLAGLVADGLVQDDPAEGTLRLPGE